MRAAEFINESPELAEKYKAHLIKTLPLLMNFLSKTSKEYLPTEDEMLNVIETGYEVMLQSGDKNKAGEAVRNKLKSLISKQSVTESLYVDVPNENWLQDKIDYAKSKGRDRWGAPFFNSTTASFREQNVRVPIEILRRLPGMRNEQKNVRTKDLIAIKKIMKSTGKLPMHNNKEYVPFIMVAYNGEAWVNEGNHRIMAAAELFDEGDKRFAELPIELRYFDGGERVKSGVLSPEKIGNQNVMEGSYREGGSITHDGVEYDFDSVMSIAEKMPTKTCSVDKLSWVLQYDTPNKERLERADITVPLIVTKSVNGKLAAIDGLHRLAKAVRDNVKTLPVKYIKPSELESAKLNKQGVSEGISNAVIFFRGEPILSQERLNQLKSSIGKPYPILRKEGSAKNIGTYMTNEKIAKGYITVALAGQGKGGAVTKIAVDLKSFQSGDGGIDEAVIITNIAGLVSDQTPNKNDPLRIQDRKKAMLKYLGPGVKKYLNDPLLSDPKIVQSWYNPEFAQQIWNTIKSGKQAEIKPGESNILERMKRILDPLAEKIRRDPEVISYFIAHKPNDWVEYNFRMNSDGSGTKVLDVKYYPPAKQGVAEDTVDEMALASYKTLGDFSKPGSFRGVDKRLVSHPKSEIKAAKFFEQTPYDFRLFFANKPGLRQYQEYGPMTPDQIVKVFGEEDAKTILDNHDDAITVVYVSNIGAEKVMMTPWIMAHRFGHAIQAGVRRDKWSAWRETEKIFFSTVNRLLDEYYGKVGSVFDFRKADQPSYNLTPEYNALFNAIGTQKSSRTGQIRRPYEFMYELFAQYLGTGTITLNPLPTNLGYGRKVFGNPSKYLNIKPEFRDETERRQVSEMLASDMELMFNDVLGNSVGRVYVM